MTDADNKDTSADTQQGSTGNSKVTEGLDSVKAMLEQMNSQFQAMTNTMVEASKAKTQPIEQVTDDDVYEPVKLKQKIMNEAGAMTRDILKAERAKDLMIYNLAQEYPEIQTKAEVKNAVIEAQKSLPAALRDTAEGYEMAVLKAVAKHGVLPKSKRQVVDDDFSAGSGGGSSSSSNSRRSSKGKVSQETLMFAQLMGRDINDPKVIKGLEEASQRQRWNKYE